MASKYQNKIRTILKKNGYEVINIIKLSESGYPDLLAIKKDLPDLWIECKELNDTLKPLQKYRIDSLINMGKIAFCIQKDKGIIYPFNFKLTPNFLTDPF